MSRIRPKGKSFTPEQEAHIKQAEMLFTSARILERGVAAFLNSADEYFNESEMDQAAAMLNTACVERKQARGLRDLVRMEQAETEPTRKINAVLKRRRRGEANALNA